MDEIIKINYDKDQPTVSARELHEGLEIKTAFKDWFPRMAEYGFTEGRDFCSKMSESTGGRPARDYEITVDMAKQICMLQRTEKGMIYRQYFLDLEKAWNTPEQIFARAVKMADNVIDKLKAENTVLLEDIERMRPKEEFFDAVADSKDAIEIGKVAKILNFPGIGRNKLFSILRKKKILMENNIPYQKYIDSGWFRTIEQKYSTPDGEVKISIKTLVYQKGVNHIRNMLCTV